MKKILAFALLLVCLLTLPACGCEHEIWKDADCLNPRTCANCGETEGYPVGHSWIIANCTTAQTCEVCGTVSGEPLGHKWVDATYEAPQTCTVCGETEGEAIPIPFLGKWEFTRTINNTDFGIKDFEYTLSAVYTLHFYDDGSVTLDMSSSHRKELLDSVIKFYEEYIYYELQSGFGMDRDAVDAFLQSEFGSDINTLAIQSVHDAKLDETLNSITHTGTWNFREGMVYIDLCFIDLAKNLQSDPQVPNSFTCEGDTFTLTWSSVGLEEPIVMTRIGK